MANLNFMDPFATGGGRSIRSGSSAMNDPGGSGAGPMVPATQASPPVPTASAGPGPGKAGGPFTWFLALFLLWCVVKWIAEERVSAPTLSLAHIRPSLYNIVVIWISYKVANYLITWAVATPAVRQIAPGANILLQAA